MNTLIISTLVILSSGNVSEKLLSAIEMVESGGRATVVGDSGKAVGAYQIWECVIKDVNRVCGTKYKASDRLDRNKSRQICKLYLEYWGKQYQKKTGKKPDNEVYSSLWCSGPNGWNKTNQKNVKKYIEKVKKTLQKK